MPDNAKTIEKGVKGGIAALTISLLWSIQGNIAQQRQDLSVLINTIDKRVTVLETTHKITEQGGLNVQRFTQ
jgi:hypothetical protein